MQKKFWRENKEYYGSFEKGPLNDKNLFLLTKRQIANLKSCLF